MSDCCSSCVDECEHDKCEHYIRGYARELDKKSEELTGLERQTGKLEEDLLKVMNLYDITMLELEKGLETDYYNTLAKMYATTTGFTAQFNQLRQQIAQLEERYAAENDEYLQMLSKFYYDVRKCPDYR